MPYEMPCFMKNAAPDEPERSKGYTLIIHSGLDKFGKLNPRSRLGLAQGKRDIYLFFCLGIHDFSIGMITKFDEDEEYT